MYYNLMGTFAYGSKEGISSYISIQYSNIPNKSIIRLFADFLRASPYIMVQRVGDTLVGLLGKSYFIRR